MVFQRLFSVLAYTSLLLTKGAYSKIMDGFQEEGSAIETPFGILCCCGARCPVAIITRDCTAGESLLLSTPPAEIGGEMGWLV